MAAAWPPNRAAGERSLPAFVALVFALSVPFWAVAAWTGIVLAEGLPISALAAVCPGLAAALLATRAGGRAGLGDLLRRALASGRIAGGWWLVAVLLVPAATVLPALAAGDPMRPVLPLPALALAIAAFVAFSWCEEVGWSGYATDPAQARWTALGAGLLIGAVWAIWHLAPLAQAGRPPDWVAWWALYTVVQRVLIVWVYANTGRSVVAAALFHASANATSVAVAGAFAPQRTGLLLALVAAAVVARWGPRTLAGR